MQDNLSKKGLQIYLLHNLIQNHKKDEYVETQSKEYVETQSKDNTQQNNNIFYSII